MASPTPLLHLPISSGGFFTLTSPTSQIYLLTFSSPPDNRVTIPFMQTFNLALDIFEQHYPKGSVVVLSSDISKFFSNGFDLDHVGQNANFFDGWILPLLRRLVAFPFPLVALVNGHAFGAGFFLALASDYRVMNPAKGFLCLPEVDLGVLIPPPMQFLLSRKMNSHAYRAGVLEGKRFDGKEALQLGLVDALGGLDEAIALVEEKKLVGKGGGNSAFAGLKEELWREVLDRFTKEAQLEDKVWREAIEKENTDRQEAAQKTVEDWESRGGKARL